MHAVIGVLTKRGHGHGHDRSFAVMHAVMDGQVMDASTIIDYGRVHDRSWAVMHTVMYGHGRVNGRVHDRPWSVIHAVMDAVHDLSN